MNAYPFSIFKRADRSCFSVSFKDPNGKYLRPVSTGKRTEAEALQAAFIMLREGIQQKQKTVTVNDLSLNGSNDSASKKKLLLTDCLLIFLLAIHHTTKKKKRKLLLVFTQGNSDNI